MAAVNRSTNSSRSGSSSPNSDGPKAAMKKPVMSEANAAASPVCRQRSIAAFGVSATTSSSNDSSAKSPLSKGAVNSARERGRDAIVIAA
jgi:hypothetical protein